MTSLTWEVHIDGLMQDCGNSIADAMELPQSCTKPSQYTLTLALIPMDAVIYGSMGCCTAGQWLPWDWCVFSRLSAASQWLYVDWMQIGRIGWLKGMHDTYSPHVAVRWMTSGTPFTNMVNFNLSMDK